LQCVLAARILTVNFVVCTLTVKKNIRAGFDMSDRTIPLSVHVNCTQTMVDVLLLRLIRRLESNSRRIFTASR
jgi:hypothetical protein